MAYKYKEGDKLIVECHAEHFLEPISSFIFCTQQDVNTISAEIRNEAMCMTNQINGIQLQNGYKTNAIIRSISKGTVPGFPFIIEFKSSSPFDIEMVMHEKSYGEFHPIPLVNSKKY